MVRQTNPPPLNMQRQGKAIKDFFNQTGSGLILAALALFIVTLVLFRTVRMGRVQGEEVGILLNKINGKVDVIDEAGVRLYNGLTKDFYVLSKTLKTLEMTEDPSRGDRSGKDDLKIKTSDGSDVYVDLIVQYKIDPALAETIIRTSGPGTSYEKKWMRDYIRSSTRNYLGELSTEEFYDSSQRNSKILKAKADINEHVKDFGLIVDSIVIPRKPHFYKEYEKMIRDKKLADQEVLEEKSKELAAKQRQKTMIVEATNIKNVAIEQYKGKMEQKKIQAKAEGERVRKEADAYYDSVTIGAEAELYKKQKAAEGIIATKRAEALGIEALKKALEGEGGRNMVKLEYAKKLKNIRISGQPFTRASHIEKYEHSKAPAAAAGK